MGFFNGMWELTKAFASGEAQRELGQIFREAGHDFITDVLLIDIDQKIDKKVAAQELANHIKANLDNGNYGKVNIGLTAEVTNIQQRANKAIVDFSVHSDDSETCQIKMASEYGTDLEIGDRLKLTLK